MEARKPKDSEVFGYIVRNEDCSCTAKKLLQAFPQFKSEEGLAQWVENLRSNRGRKLLTRNKSGASFTVVTALNGARTCTPYWYGNMCKDSCSRIHLCRYQLAGRCSKGGRCQRSHDIGDAHNSRILLEKWLSDLDKKLILKALKHVGKNYNKKKTSQKKSQRAGSDAAETLSVVSEVESISVFDDDDDREDPQEDIEEAELFRVMLTKYGGKCTVRRLIEENPHLGQLKSHLDEIEAGPIDEDWFRVSDGQVSVQLACIKICPKYKKNTCTDGKCRELHVCRFGVHGSCKYGAKCKFHHKLKNDHDASLISELESKGLNEEDILHYLKIQTQDFKSPDEDDSDADSVVSDVSRASSSAVSRTVRSDVVTYILKQHQGRCKFSDLLLGSFDFRNQKDIQEFISRDENKGLFTTEGNMVRVVLRSAEICEEYQTKSCNMKCSKFHLCLLLVQGSCAEGKCNRLHSLSHPTNRARQRRQGLEDIKEADILLYLKLLHQERQQDETNVKNLFHQDRQQYETNVKSKGALDKDAARNDKPRAEVASYRKGSLGSGNERKGSEHEASGGDEKLDSHALENLKDLNALGDTAKRRKRDVLNWLLDEEDGCGSLVNLHQAMRHEFNTTVELQAWLTGPQGKAFCVVKPAVTPEETLVMLFVPAFQICFHYISDKDCREKNCTFLHLCMDFALDACARSNCSLSHNPRSPHNQTTLKKVGVEFDSDDDLLNAIGDSIPSVCAEHNAPDGCRDSTRCRKFHICAKYLQFSCPQNICTKGHDLKNFHNNGLISALGMKDGLIFKTLQMTCHKDQRQRGRKRQQQKAGARPRPNHHPTQSQSGPAQGKGSRQPATVSIDQMTILKYLVNHSNDDVLVEDLKLFDGPNKYTSEEILQWAYNAEGRDVCVVRPDSQPGKCTIKLSVKGLQLCFGYYGKTGCSKENCAFLHLCRDAVAGYCARKQCRYSHDVMDAHNVKVIQRLQTLSKEELMKATSRSAPQVCPHHNTSQGCSRVSCMKFHYCADKVKHKCGKEDCPKDHHLNSEHNQKLLKIYQKPENVIFMMLMVPTSAEETKKKETIAAEEAKEKQEEQKKLAETVLVKMLRVFGGSCSLALFLINFQSVKEAQLTTPDFKKYFQVITMPNQEARVIVKMRLDLCFGYTKTSGCDKGQRCGYLHLCRAFVAGHCSRGGNCKFSHNVAEKQNNKVLNDLGIPKSISEEHVLILIQNSLPRVCEDHNSVMGCKDKNCLKFHVCSSFVKRACSRAAHECVYGHSYDTAHNDQILQVLGAKAEDISGKVIAPDMKPDGKAPHSLNARRPVKPMEGDNRPIIALLPTPVQPLLLGARKPVTPSGVERHAQALIMNPIKPSLGAKPKHRAAHITPAGCGCVPMQTGLGTQERKSGISPLQPRDVLPHRSADILVQKSTPTSGLYPHLPTSHPYNPNIPSSDYGAGATNSPLLPSAPPVHTPSAQTPATPTANQSQPFIDLHGASAASGDVKPARTAHAPSSSTSGVICTEIKIQDGARAPAASICREFLKRKCRNQQCPRHHVSLPYMWCYDGFDTWVPFDDSANEELEEMYCDPDNDYGSVS